MIINKKWFLKNWSNILFGIFIILMIIPTTRMPIQVFINRLFLFGPSTEKKEITIESNNFNWEVINEQNERINIQSFVGKPILLNFWATWCPPCVAEIKSIHIAFDQTQKNATCLLVSNEPI